MYILCIGTQHIIDVLTISESNFCKGMKIVDHNMSQERFLDWHLLLLQLLLLLVLLLCLLLLVVVVLYHTIAAVVAPAASAAASTVVLRH